MKVIPKSVTYGTRATKKRERKNAIIGWAVGVIITALYFWFIIFVF